MEVKDLRVFVCVPGVGKTYLAEHDERFIDFDIIRARYKYGIDGDKRQFEENKGNRGKVFHDDANEYIEKLFLDYFYNSDKILLFAPNPAMVDMIVSHNIPYCLVYHSKDEETVNEIRQRMRERGNQENFINSMTAPEIMDIFYQKSLGDNRPALKIELFKGEYLSDKLLPIFAKN